MNDLLLFVYGSLRRDRALRHHPLLRGAAYVDRATTRGKLYRVSWHPGFQPDGSGDPVTGEVFRIPAARREEIQRALDGYEGPEFHLQSITAVLPDGTEAMVSTYEWLGLPSVATYLPEGDFGPANGHPPDA
jgi:gamma-glutamylcyclotransferase (GGCT)/AIG2-like uncharacterized protein YtfP